MTVAAQNVVPQIVAAIGQTVFPFAWRCDTTNLVAVYVNDAVDGGFTVLLNADQVAAPGGTVTRATPAIGGEVVSIERTSPQTQSAAFTRYGPFPAATVSTAFDKAVMLIQEVAATLLRSVRVARSQFAKMTSLELPTPQDGAALIFQNDPFVVGSFRLATFVAASKQYLESYVQQFIANGGVVQPLSWVVIGDDVTQNFNIAGAVFNSPDVYFVVVGGVPQEPTTDYTVNVAVNPPQIQFTAPPPLNQRAVVRSLGYAKAISTDTISGDLGDASVVLTPGTSMVVNRFATALTANRTVTLVTVGVPAGSKFRIVRTGLGNFTLNVGGGLKVMPVLTAAFVDVMYDGAAWRLTAYGTL